MPEEIFITHLDYYIAIEFGDKVFYHEHQSTTHIFAKERGYKFNRVEKNKDNRAIEIWRLKDAI